MKESFIVPIQIRTMPDTGIAAGSNREISGKGGVETFKGIFQEAINNVEQTERTLVNEQYLLATGQTEDAHSVMIASSQAQLAVDMLVSLRNKAMESYNELMRISL